MHTLLINAEHCDFAIFITDTGSLVTPDGEHMVYFAVSPVDQGAGIKLHDIIAPEVIYIPANRLAREMERTLASNDHTTETTDLGTHSH